MKYLGFIFVFLIYSCDSKNLDEMKDNLNGYWEIESVTDAEGFEKSFSVNTTVDFIEVIDLKGTRKKVSPQLDGTFLTFAQNEAFEVKVENNTLVLVYLTPYDEWEETVLESTKENLIIKNAEGKIYLYKRYKPFIIKNE